MRVLRLLPCLACWGLCLGETQTELTFSELNQPGTLDPAGLDLDLQLKKGQVDHQSEPARALRELQQQKGSSTGEPRLRRGWSPR